MSIESDLRTLANTRLVRIIDLEAQLERVRQAIEGAECPDYCFSRLGFGRLGHAARCDCIIARLKAAFYGKEVEGGG